MAKHLRQQDHEKTVVNMGEYIIIPDQCAFEENKDKDL